MDDLIYRMSQWPINKWLGPTWAEWSVFLAGSVILPTLFVLARSYLTRWEPKSFHEKAPIAVELIHSIANEIKSWFLIMLGVWISSKAFDNVVRYEIYINKIFTVFAFVQAGILSIVLLDWAIDRVLDRSRTHAAQSTIVSQSIFRFLVRLIVVIGFTLSLLDNLGVEIKTLVTGLGIGGIAVALAVQNVLGDLLASLSIALDRPFEVGDSIILDSERGGTVEQIGVKTTRIRSFTGEQLIVSNNDLLKAQIRNFKRMDERRMITKFGVTYETPRAKVAAIPSIVRGILQQMKMIRVDRVHFVNFGPSSLDFEVVWFVLSPDGNLSMDLQQQFNLALMEHFEKEGIAFAYPTQVLYLNNNLARQNVEPLNDR